MEFEWRCPSCDAGPHKHGHGACELNVAQGECTGFVCECHTTERHGRSGAAWDIFCPNASCHHCGWSGPYPQMIAIPRIDEFSSFMSIYRDSRRSDAKIKVESILYEWMAQCFDDYLDGIDDIKVCGLFTNRILLPMWSFMIRSSIKPIRNHE